MIRFLFFGALGLLLGFAVVAVAAGFDTAVWAFPVGLTLAILTGTFWLIARAGGGGALMGASAATQAAARAAGRIAIARIDAAKQTNIELNGAPLMDLTLSVAATHRAPFRTKVRGIVPVSKLPEYAVGERKVVLLTTIDGVELVIVDDDPYTPQWRNVRIPEAHSLGDPLPQRPGVAKPDGRMRRPLVGTSKAWLPLRIVIYLVVMGAAATAVIYPHRAAVEAAVTSVKAGQGLHPNLALPEFLRDGLEKISAAAGTDVASEVVVYGDRITAEVPLIKGKKPSDDWDYSKGTVERRGPSTIQPRSAGEQFALKSVKWDAIWPALQEVSRRSGMSTETAIVHVSRDVNTDIKSGNFGEFVGPVQVTLSLSDDYGGAQFRMNADSTGLKQIG